MLSFHKSSRCHCGVGLLSKGTRTRSESIQLPVNSMGGLLRDRGCLYYIPWICTMAMSLLGGAIGVWIHYSISVYHHTKDGLSALGVSAANEERLQPVVIATAVIILSIIVALFLLSIARSFIEAAHDATGLCGHGSLLWMVLNVLVSMAWWVLVLWIILVLEGDTMWAGLLYVIRGCIKSLIDQYGPQPDVAWLPSSGAPCPPQCFDLTRFSFIYSDLSNSCTCNYQQLQTAYNEFDSGLMESRAVLAGIWVMLGAAVVLLVNFACQYAHTHREREYIKRLVSYQYYHPA